MEVEDVAVGGVVDANLRRYKLSICCSTLRLYIACLVFDLSNSKISYTFNGFLIIAIQLT